MQLSALEAKGARRERGAAMFVWSAGAQFASTNLGVCVLASMPAPAGARRDADPASSHALPGLASGQPQLGTQARYLHRAARQHLVLRKQYAGAGSGISFSIGISCLYSEEGGLSAITGCSDGAAEHLC